MRLPRWLVLPSLAVLALFPGCSPAQLDAPPGKGLVIVDARVVVKCLHTGYVNSAYLDFLRPQLVSDNPGRPPLLVMGRRGGGGGYDYYEPPCDDNPAHFSSATNVVDRVWIKNGDQHLSGRSRNGLLVVTGVPPGDWKVESLGLNFCFGGLVYVVRLPGTYSLATFYYTWSAQLPETTVHVEPGEVAYAGVFSVLATRDVAYRDSVGVSYRYDSAIEQVDWKRILAGEPGPTWESAIRSRMAALPPTPGPAQQ